LDILGKLRYQSSKKMSKNFYCQKCDYTTSHRNNFTKHCLSRKHSGIENIDTAIEETSDTIVSCQYMKKAFKCNFCNKDFFSYSGKWSHEQKCIPSATAQPPAELMNYLIKENQELKSSMMQLIEKNDEKLTKLVIELCKNTQPTNNTLIQNNNCNNTTNNNSFNLNFFLNETCKDALNMSDFIKSIQVGFEDIERIGNVGYVDGISGIIIKSLQELGVEKRPIHCTDAKRQTLYIKENNEWTKEDADWSHLQHMVNEVQKINLRQLPAWREHHPNCLTSTSKYTNTYNTMSQELMGGDCKKVKIQVKDNKIMSRIMKEVIIDKSLFTLGG
jgi:hypothetical protein